MHAYEALKSRDPLLVAEYEQQLVSSGVPHIEAKQPSMSQERIATIVKQKLENRNTKRLVTRLGTRPIKIRENGENIIKFILWANSFISAAVSTQPYAALAWSGVSIILPGKILLRSYSCFHLLS